MFKCDVCDDVLTTAAHLARHRTRPPRYCPLSGGAFVRNLAPQDPPQRPPRPPPASASLGAKVASWLPSMPTSLVCYALPGRSSLEWCLHKERQPTCWPSRCGRGRLFLWHTQVAFNARDCGIDVYPVCARAARSQIGGPATSRSPSWIPARSGHAASCLSERTLPRQHQRYKNSRDFCSGAMGPSHEPLPDSSCLLQPSRPAMV